MNKTTDTLIEFPAVPSNRSWRTRARALWTAVLDVVFLGVAI